MNVAGAAERLTLQVADWAVARTLPGKQFGVGWRLRARIAAGFLRQGINLPTALQNAEPAGTD